MDKISGLSEDEFLVKILSYLPTRTAVSTSVLSKRWKYLWKRVSKLEYDDSDNTSEKNFRLFVETNLPIEREPELESLRFSFRSNLVQPEDIKSWVEIAVSRGIRDLSITNSSPLRYNWNVADILPYCKSLVTLKLEYNIFLQRTFFWFPSLKTLQLRSVIFSSSTLQSFLSNCPVLENLIVENNNCYNLREISVPTFKSLSLCLTVKTAKEVHSDGIVFNHLENLKLCTCNKYWSKLLVHFLEYSPNLRALELYLNEDHSSFSQAPFFSWKNHYVPQCFVTSFETFKWIGYEGRKKDRGLVTYILNNARCLKTARIAFTNSRIVNPQKKLELMKLTSRASPTCKLVFN